MCEMWYVMGFAIDEVAPLACLAILQRVLNNLKPRV